MANTQPIFSSAGDIQWVNGITAANTNSNIVAGTSYLAFATGATTGGYVQRIRFRPLGTNVATVARLWLNNGSTPSGATANNVLFDEVSLAASTGATASALANTEIPVNVALPAGYKIYVSLGTAVAAGYDVTVVGGTYK
jgi:hypothetical protein